MNTELKQHLNRERLIFNPIINAIWFLDKSKPVKIVCEVGHHWNNPLSNKANAELIIEAFDNFIDTGMTPAELNDAYQEQMDINLELSTKLNNIKEVDQEILNILITSRDLVERHFSKESARFRNIDSVIKKLEK